MTNKFDKSDERLREQYEEAFFQELMEGYDEYQGEKLKREAEAKNGEGPSPELIAQMEEKIAKEIGRQKRLKSIPRFRRIGKYVAVFVVVIVTVFSVSFVSVDAFRTRILNYFFENQGESTVHVIQQTQSGVFSPSYIPEGISVVLYSDDIDPIEILLQSDDNTYYANILIYDSQSKVHSDTEGALSIEPAIINDVEGEYCQKEGRASLVWYNNEQTYIAQMNSNLPKEEMIHIAQSINF